MPFKFIPVSFRSQLFFVVVLFFCFYFDSYSCKQKQNKQKQEKFLPFCYANVDLELMVYFCYKCITIFYHLNFMICHDFVNWKYFCIELCPVFYTL